MSDTRRNIKPRGPIPSGTQGPLHPAFAVYRSQYCRGLLRYLAGDPGYGHRPWHFDHAAKAIGFAILFDGLDGRIARMTNTTSSFGRELDSLADVITFGIAPAILAWLWGFRSLPLMDDSDLRSKVIQLGAIATFVFLMAGAARLARFNIQTNPQPSNPGRPGKKYFVGMPIPAGAGVVAALVHFMRGNPLQEWWQSIAWAVFVFVIAFLDGQHLALLQLQGIGLGEAAKLPLDHRYRGRHWPVLVLLTIRSVLNSARIHAGRNPGSAFFCYAAANSAASSSAR